MSRSREFIDTSVHNRTDRTALIATMALRLVRGIERVRMT